ncbi:MAG: hypothetical protein WAL50_19410 [Kineosporiaceae bacterium]
MLRTTRRASIVGLVLLLLGSGGGAYAYWTVTSLGTGSAATGTASPLVVNQTTTVTGLYPGGAAALSGTFDNPNPGAVYVTAVTATLPAFSVQPDIAKPACTQSDFSITGTSNTPGSVVAGVGVGSWSGLTLAMTNTGANQDNCMGLGVIQIAYTAH